MSSRSKLVLSLALFAFVIIAAVVGVVAVLGATQQTVKSIVDISFRAVDIDGSVTAKYKVQNKTENALIDGIDVDGNVVFKATGSIDGELVIAKDEPVSLRGSSQALYIEYSFTCAEVNYRIDSSFANTLFKAEYFNGEDWIEITNDNTLILEQVNDEGSSVLIRISAKELKANVDKTSIQISFLLTNPNV